MRVGYVLLGLVTVASVYISSGQTCSNDIIGVQNRNTCCNVEEKVALPDPAERPLAVEAQSRTHGLMCSDTNIAPCIIDTCSNGVQGIQNGDTCCDCSCGECGGSGCAGRPGGASSCCGGPIEDSGLICSDTMAAPCIIDTCSNGVQGIQNGDVCCDGSCAECGGMGCAGRPGGASSCCGGPIEDSGLVCSDTMAAPCIIDTCSNGVQGIQNGDTCCDGACGECGGMGCAGRPGGAASCCGGPIADSGLMCSDNMQAPCIIDTCSNGVQGIQNGNVCCDGACGECGGMGCSGLPGGTSSCCAGPITDGGVLCSDTNAAPCVIDTYSNHFQGIQNGDVCCDGACGECGGSGCASRPGGAANCCMGTITTSGMDCSVAFAAPCFVDNPLVCSDGTLGIEGNGVCCEAQCGGCSGFGCNQLPGGSESCCTGGIMDSGIVCGGTTMAPCILPPLPVR